MQECLSDLCGKMRLSNPQLVPKLLRGILFDLEMDIPDMPDGETLDTLASSVDPVRLGNHPVKMSTDDIREVYRRAFTPLCAAEKTACMDIWKYYCD